MNILKNVLLVLTFMLLSIMTVQAQHSPQEVASFNVSQMEQVIELSSEQKTELNAIFMEAVTRRQTAKSTFESEGIKENLSQSLKDISDFQKNAIAEELTSEQLATWNDHKSKKKR